MNNNVRIKAPGEYDGRVRGSSSTMKERNAVPLMPSDKGRRAQTSTKRSDDNERGGPTKSLDDGRRKMRTENASIGVVRVADGVSVSDTRQKVPLSLSACMCTDTEPCAGGGRSMIDIGVAMSITVMIMLCSSVELKR